METTDRIAEALEVEDHGVDGAQYFQGAGVALTDFEDCATGTGNTPREALESALESLACSGWTLSDELEAQALEELGDAEHADRDYVSEELSLAIESELPREEWSVRFASHCGMAGVPEDFETRAEALECATRILARRREQGFPVSELRAFQEWEVEEPEDAGSVSDLAGILWITSNVDEREALRERWTEESELYYYVTVRVR